MKTIFIVAGETSGDRHGASLVEALKEKCPETQFTGLGGKYLEAAGVKLLYNITDLAVVGFFEVLNNLEKFRRIFTDTLAEIKRIRPRCVILVDYPGFNLRLAKELKKIGIPVVYYISPQVWAWNNKRVKIIKKYVDKMLVLFDFEKEFYARYGVDVEFVGHPLLDAVKTETNPSLFLKNINFKEEKDTISLLPGSRKKEIYRLLPIMLEAARIIDKRSDKNNQFILIESSIIKGDPCIQSLLNKYKDLKLIRLEESQIYDALFASDFAIVASGTATLETALLSTPMIIIYKISWPSWLLAKLLIRIPYIGLVNIVAGKKIVPELIQSKARPRRIGKLCLEILTDREKHKSLILELDAIKKKLGLPGASERAAEIIAKFIQ